MTVFLEVVRLGSIRRAADSLEISQPAISSALADLQRDLKASLVERVGRGIGITPAGRTYAEYGRRIIALLTEAREAVKTVASGHSKLRLSAVTTAAESFMPALLRDFSLSHPEVEIQLNVANREAIWDQLTHWEVDVVVAGRPPDVPRCRTLALRANQLAVVAPVDVVQRGTLLRELTWLLREPGSGTRGATEELFGQLEIDPPTLSIGSNGAIRACVRAGLGVSLLSVDAVATDIDEGRLGILPTFATPMERNWHLVTNADRALTTAAHRFVAFVLAGGFFSSPQPLARNS